MQKTTSKSRVAGRSSHRQTSAGTPRARVRRTISGLASDAWAKKPRSISPAASRPIPQAQSSTRLPSGGSHGSNASTLPAGVSSSSGVKIS